MGVVHCYTLYVIGWGYPAIYGGPACMHRKQREGESGNP